MADDIYDETYQLQVALSAIQTQPPDAQIRMVEWLTQRVHADAEAGRQAREAAAKARIALRNNQP